MTPSLTTSATLLVFSRRARRGRDLRSQWRAVNSAIAACGMNRQKRGVLELRDVLLQYRRRKRHTVLAAPILQCTYELRSDFDRNGCPYPIWFRREACDAKLWRLK